MQMATLHTELKAPPAKPPSVFFIWSKANMARVIKKLPHLTDAQLMSLLEKIWNKLSQRVKKPYYDVARLLRQQWLEDMVNWKATEANRRFLNGLNGGQPLSPAMYSAPLDLSLPTSFMKNMDQSTSPLFLSENRNSLGIPSALAADRSLSCKEASQGLNKEYTGTHLQSNMSNGNIPSKEDASKTTRLPISTFLKQEKRYLEC